MTFLAYNRSSEPKFGRLEIFVYKSKLTKSVILNYLASVFWSLLTHARTFSRVARRRQELIIP